MLYFDRFYIFTYLKTFLQQDGQGNGAEMWDSTSKFMVTLPSRVAQLFGTSSSWLQQLTISVGGN